MFSALSKKAKKYSPTRCPKSDCIVWQKNVGPSSLRPSLFCSKTDQCGTCRVSTVCYFFSPAQSRDSAAGVAESPSVEKLANGRHNFAGSGVDERPSNVGSATGDLAQEFSSLQVSGSGRTEAASKRPPPTLTNRDLKIALAALKQRPGLK